MNNILKNRSILTDISNQIENDLIIVLIGARQVGKSTILQMLGKKIRQIHPTNPVLFFNLEKPDVLSNFTDYRSILNYLDLQGVDKNKTNYIFLDEFQKMPAPTQTLKILHDDYPYLKIFVSGSSSLDILQKLRVETMAGRKRIINIYSLSFKEFLDFRSNIAETISFERAVNTDLDTQPLNSQFVPLWENHTIWGGYPRSVLSLGETEKKETIAEIYRSYVERDVPQFLDRNDDIIFRKFVSMLSAQSGTLFNVNELSKMLGITRFIAEKYLFVLEHTFIIKLLKPFYTNKQKEIIKMPKLYFLDNGLRNWSSQNFNSLESRSDAGQLVENAVLSELYKYLPVDAQLNFWRTPQGAEVDFILRQGDKIIPIEVKYQPFTSAKVPTGLKAFIENYHSTSAVVLTRDFYGQAQHSDCAVYFWPTYLTEKIITKFLGK